MSRFDWQKFELVHQVGGIRTARLDWPEAGGSPGCRVALVNTGSGLRYTVALDRGGDIVDGAEGDRGKSDFKVGALAARRSPLHTPTTHIRFPSPCRR